MQILLQFLQEPLGLRDVTHDMQFVVLTLQTELFPHVEQEVEGIAAVVGLERIAELEAVLLEAEDVDVTLVEIGVELVAMTSVAALVEIAPDGSHRLDEDHIFELVAEHASEILVDGKDTDALQVGQDVVEDGALFLAGREGVVEDRGNGFLLELFYGNEHGWCVDEHLGPTGVDGHQVGRLEGLAEVGSHRDAALDDIGFVEVGPLRIGEVGHRKREGVPPDAYNHLSLVHYRALVMLATQRTNSPTAITASMMLISRLLICISAAKLIKIREIRVIRAKKIVSLHPL